MSKSLFNQSVPGWELQWSRLHCFTVSLVLSTGQHWWTRTKMFTLPRAAPTLFTIILQHFYQSSVNESFPLQSHIDSSPCLLCLVNCFSVTRIILVLSSECWVESLRAMVAGGGWVRNEQVIQHEQSPLVILTLALQDTALHWSFYSDHHWFIAPDHDHTWDSSTDHHQSPSTILSSSADNHQWHNVLQWLIACKDIHCLQIIIKMI